MPLMNLWQSDSLLILQRVTHDNDTILETITAHHPEASGKKAGKILYLGVATEACRRGGYFTTLTQPLTNCQGQYSETNVKPKT